MKVRNYMEENNTELLFTDENIMKAIMKISPENRKYILSIAYNDLFSVANSSEYTQNFINICEQYIEGYTKMKDVICEFLEKIHEQSSEDVITEMVNNYKDLSREERLEFNKKLKEESTIENKLDMFDYDWKHLIDSLQKVVKA